MNAFTPALRSGRLVGSLLACVVVATSVSALESSGLVEPVWEATLASTVLGRVERLCVKEGQRVEAGTVLLELERRSEQLDAGRRRLVVESKVELEIAKTRLELLRDDLEATRKLYEGSRSVSKDDYVKKTLEFKLAEAEVAQLTQRGKIEQLEYEFAEEQVKRREIATPQAGTVIEILPQPGEVCEPRQPLVRIVDASSVRITLDIDALRAPHVEVGQSVPVRVKRADGVIEAAGTIDFVSPVVDAASGLKRIRVAIPNADGRLTPGLSATVAFDIVAKKS